MKNFSQNDIISIRDLSKDNLEEIYSKTNEIIEMKAEERREIARGKTLGYLFFEPSTELDLVFNQQWLYLVVPHLELLMQHHLQFKRVKV